MPMIKLNNILYLNCRKFDIYVVNTLNIEHFINGNAVGAWVHLHWGKSFLTTQATFWLAARGPIDIIPNLTVI